MSTSPPTEVSYEEFYEFHVKQAFWNGIDLKFDECENLLVFQLVLTDGNPILSICFTFNSNDGTPPKDFEVRGEEISQIIFTPLKLCDKNPCVLVLRLTVAAYELIKNTLPQKFGEWEQLMQRKQVHCTAFSDNLIFVIDPSDITYKENEDVVLYKTWATDIDEILDHIEFQWQSYLEHTLKWDSRDCQDLVVPLEKRNIKNFKREFGLKKTKPFVQESNDLYYRGFKIIPVDHNEEGEEAADTIKSETGQNGFEDDEEPKNENEGERKENKEQKKESVFEEEFVLQKKVAKNGSSDDLDYDGYC